MSNEAVVSLRPAGSSQTLDFTIDPNGTRLGDFLARATAEQGLQFNDVAVGIRSANGGENVDFPSIEDARESEARLYPGDEVAVSQKRANG